MYHSKSMLNNNIMYVSVAIFALLYMCRYILQWSSFRASKQCISEYIAVGKATKLMHNVIICSCFNIIIVVLKLISPDIHSSIVYVNCIIHLLWLKTGCYCNYFLAIVKTTFSILEI